MNSTAPKDIPEGLAAERKAKRKAYYHGWYLKNKDRVLKQAAKWRTENPERFNEARRIYLEKNADKLRVYFREYGRIKKATDPEFRLRSQEIAKRSNLKNRAKRTERQRLYYKKNAQAIRERKRAWKKRNRHKETEREMRRQALKKGRTVDGLSVKFYEFVRRSEEISCYWCGKSISGLIAHVDHVIALNRGGNHCSSNLCASCPECNLSKNDRLPTEWIKSGQLKFNM